MPIPPHLSEFWRGFTTAVPGADAQAFYEAFRFGDSAHMADELAELVLRGRKRATASAVWTYEATGKPLPRPGDLSILLDGAGIPRGVIETRSVDLVPFDEVTAAFATAEGEGDGSLASWREGHRRYFTRECAQAGREFNGGMLIACEHFALVHGAPASPI